MHLSLDLIRPDGERVADGCEYQPRLRNRDYSRFILWVVGSFRHLKKDHGPCSAIFHGVLCHPIQSQDFHELGRLAGQFRTPN
jgi:hypothetical protein